MVSFEFRQTSSRLLFGPGRSKDIAIVAEESGCCRVSWIVDPYFAGGVGARRFAAVTEGFAAPSAVHAIPAGEPDTEAVRACCSFLLDTAPDLVVALGGGSTMDATKVARMMLANSGSVEDLSASPALRRPDTLFVCIPTTAGTGSEASEMAVISKAGSDVKLRVRSPQSMPDVAILDPELLIPLSETVTAQTGFDAFTHALESFTSRRASDLTDLLTLDALRRLWQWLPIAVDRPDNVEARSQCLMGSHLAAVAFNNTDLGLAHAISAPLGALHHIVHGLGNALALPAVTAFNAPALAEEKRRQLLDVMGGETVAEGVAGLRARIGLDVGLEDILPSQADYDAIAAAAMKSGNIPTNARTPVLADVRAILDAMRRPLNGAPLQSALSRTLSF